VLRALKRGRDLPDRDLPQAAARESNPRLVAWAMDAGRDICAKAGIDHTVFASRRNYIDLVEAIRAGRTDTSELRLLTGWRQEFAGEALRTMIARQLRK